MAAEPTSPDPEKRYINVEFDDGDSGRIALEDIRFLLSDYPIVGKLTNRFYSSFCLPDLVRKTLALS